MNKKRRVVVTGVGIVSPNGIGNENCYKAMIGGVSAVRRVTEFDVALFNTKIAAQVNDFDPVKLGLTWEESMRMDRYVQFALVAARMALEDSKINLNKIDKERMGVSLANAICGTKYMEEEFALVTDSGTKPIDPALVRPDLYDAAMFNTPSSEISAKYGLKACAIPSPPAARRALIPSGFPLSPFKMGKWTS